jgi:hypothetical protein
MIAWVPPFKKSRTVKPRLLFSQSPPKVRSKSPKLLRVIGSLTGPRRARPRNALTDVATPVMARTPLGISSMYTPG